MSKARTDLTSGYIVAGVIRDGHSNLTGKRVTAGQAIKRFCWSCMGGAEFPWANGDGTVEPPHRPTAEVRACETETCWLYPFRTGRNPNRAGLRHGGSFSSEPSQDAESAPRSDVDAAVESPGA